MTLFVTVCFSLYLSPFFPLSFTLSLSLPLSFSLTFSLSPLSFSFFLPLSLSLSLCLSLSLSAHLFYLRLSILVITACSTEGEDPRAQQQKEEYNKRGISLTAYDADTPNPYLINLDEDSFRSNRFMYIIKKDQTVFGSKGDIQPMSLSVVRDHCVIEFNGSGLVLVGGKGQTFRNGHLVPETTRVTLAVFDRVALGDQLMLFRWAGV